MADVYQGESGQWYEFQPHVGDWVPIDEARGQAMSGGPLEAATAGLIQGTVGAGLGGLSLLGNETAGAALDDMNATLGGYGQGQPWANLAGMAAPAVVPGAVGLRAGGLPGAAAFEAAYGAGATPDAPFLGAALGATGGLVGGFALTRGPGGALTPAPQPATSSMTDRVTSAIDVDGAGPQVPGLRTMDELEGITDGPGSVQQSLGATQEANRQGLAARVLNMGADDPPSPELVAEMQRLGFKLTPADMAGTAARKNVESMMMRNPGGQAVFDEVFKRPNQEALNNIGRRSIGLPDGPNIEPSDLGLAVDGVRAKYQAMGEIVGDVTPAELIKSTEEYVNIPRTEAARKIVQDVVDSIDQTPITGDELFEVMSDLADEASQQMRLGNHTAGRALDQLHQDMQQQLISDFPEVADLMTEAKNHWRNIKLMERGSTLTEEGDISIQAMRQAMRSSRYTGSTYRRGRGYEHEASNDLLNAVRGMTQFRERIGNSGTPTGMTSLTDLARGGAIARSYIAGGLPGAAVAAGATGAGLATAGAALLD